MGKNDKEKDLLYEWGVTNHDAYQFMTIDKDAKSYFRNRQNHNYLREYYFGTLPELRDNLHLLWEGEVYMDGILQPVLVASMKNKTEVLRKSESIEEASCENREKMPAFIYNSTFPADIFE